MLCFWCSLCLTLISLSKVSCMEEIEYNTGLANEEDTKHPFWNVAHMVNSLDEVDYYLNKGANSLEFDVSFHESGNVKNIKHGPLCDLGRNCFRSEDFVKYIDYLKNLTSPDSEKYREELVLLFIDCKVNELTSEAKFIAGQDLAMKLLDHYWQRGKSGANAYILISVPSIKHMDFVKSIRRTLKAENFTCYYKKIGYDFSGNEDLNETQKVYKSAKIKKHIWQGDGITNWCYRGTKRLKDALRIRDQNKTSFIDKVYWWTVDKKDTMRKVLRMHIDGMITNFPERLDKILREGEFSKKFRLATLDDSPWKKYPFRIGREENVTGITHEDEILYNCDKGRTSKSCRCKLL